MLKKYLVCALPCMVIASVAIIAKAYTVVVDMSVPCWFNLITGYICPGCGGTRSFYALIHGDILASLKYNAFVPCVASLGIVLYVRLFQKVVLGKDVQVLPKDDTWVYVPLVVWLAYTVLRNL